MKRFLIAPDSFKESISAANAARAIDRGIRRAVPDAKTDLCPLADGGEGTVEALVCATGGTIRRNRVCGPLGEKVEAEWGLVDQGRTAVIEMAQAAGLPRVPPNRRDPMRTTTFGVGELIGRALDEGVKKILVGIGGSATTDGGTGMAQALGVRFEGVGPDEKMCGGLLPKVKAVDLSGRDARLDSIELIVACDVVNPLVGPQGAAAVYGPQKGASAEQVEKLNQGLEWLARCAGRVDPRTPGAGAAGGLGWGLMTFCGAEMRRGIELVLDAVGFEQRLQQCDAVVTGEGRLDGQSLEGKTCIGVARAAARFSRPVIALVGSLGTGAEKTLEAGIRSYHPLCREGVSAQEAMQNAGPLLEKLAEEVFRGSF